MSGGTGGGTAALARVLERLADSLLVPFMLDDVLGGLAEDVQHVLGVVGAGMMLEDEQGAMRFESTSDPLLEKLEALQIEYDEGPCLLAYRTGEVVIAGDLAVDDRFPRFGREAVLAGMRAVHSFPMRVEDRVVGAINMYSSTTGGFTPEQVDAGRVLAKVATIYLLHAQDVERLREVNRQLQGALDSRVLIEQAKGFVAAGRDTTVDVAFRSLRRYARRNGVKLRQVCAEVVERRLPLTALPDIPAEEAPPRAAGPRVGIRTADRAAHVVEAADRR